MANVLQEALEFTVVPGGKNDWSTFTQAQAKLTALIGSAEKFAAVMASLEGKVSVKFNTKELEQMLKSNPLTKAYKNNFKPEDVAKAFGIPDDKGFKTMVAKAQAQQKIVEAELTAARKKVAVINRQFEGATGKKKKSAIEENLAGARTEAERLEKKLTGIKYFMASGNFASTASAAAFGKTYFNQRDAGLKHGGSGSASASVSGVVPLVIAPDRIEAVLGPGNVKLFIPGDRIQGQSRSKNEEGGSAGGKKGKSQFVAGAAIDGDQLSETVTEYPGTKKPKTIAKTFLADVDQQITTFANDLKGEFKRVTRTSRTGKTVADLQAKLAGIQNEIKETFGSAAAVRRDPKAAAAFFTSQAATVGTFIKPGLADVGLGKWNQKFGALQAALTGKAADALAFHKESEAERIAGNKARADAFAASGTNARQKIDEARARTAKFDADEQAARDQAGQVRRLSQSQAQLALADFQARGGKLHRDDTTESWGAGGASRRGSAVYQLTANGQKEQLHVSYDDEGASVRRSRSSEPALKNKFSAATFLQNTAKVAMWAASVTALYKTVELAEYSLHRLEHTGLEMAHLGIVFRGVGGTARELTNDIIKLAAANGRGTEEAMESATEWARLGGDRAAINEEVRVSALAANIADMSMVETTKQLSALMHIYHMEAGDLNGTLGMLVNTSLKYNVTLEELFTGLDRSAAAARIAGVGLAELQSMIGVVVGGTGNTGSMTGNSLKYIFQELNKADVQKQLRGFGVETLTNGLEQKPGGQILSDLSGVFGTLGKRSQQQLSGLLGGRFNASRVPVVLENYPKILQLAIDAQLNLNKAQEANVKILDTLKAQLAGVKTEFDRMLLSSHAMLGLTAGSSAIKNVFTDVADHASNIGLTDEQIKASKKKDFEYLREHGKLHALLTSIPKAALTTFLRMNGTQIMMGLNPLGAPLYRKVKSSAGLVDIWNLGHEAPSPQGQDDFESRMGKLRQSESVSSLAAREFGLGATMNRNGSLTPENANSFADVMAKLGHGDSAKNFLQSFQRGDTAGAGKILTAEQEQALQAGAAAKAREQVELEKQTVNLKQQQAALTDKQTAALEGRGTFSADDQKNLAGVSAALQKVTADYDDNTAALEANEGELANVQISQQKYISLLKEQGDMMERIGGLYARIKATSPLDQVAVASASTAAQLDYLQRSQQEFGASPDSGTAEGKVAYDQMTAEIKKKQAELDAINSRMNRTLAENETRFGFGQDAAARNLARNSFGRDTTDILLRQRAGLDKDLFPLESRNNAANAIAGARSFFGDTGEQMPIEKALNLTLAERGQLIEDLLLKQKNFQDLVAQQPELEKEINQLLMDRNKEFTKSFFGDGPAEMLKKLSAFRMAFDDKGKKRGDLSQGQFFSMDSSMRQNYGMLNPAFDPQMIELKNALKRNIGAIGNEHDPAVAANINKVLLSFPDRLTAALKGLTPGGDGKAPTGWVDTAAKIIADAGSRFASSVDAAADRFVAKLSGFRGHGAGGDWGGAVNGTPKLTGSTPGTNTHFWRGAWIPNS